MKTKELFSRYPAKISLLKDLRSRYPASSACKSMKTGRTLRDTSKISLLKDLAPGGVSPLQGSVFYVLVSRQCRAGLLCAAAPRLNYFLRLAPIAVARSLHFQITTSMTGWVGKSATFAKLYCEWNERVGRNFWVWGLTSFKMQFLRRKKARSTGSGLKKHERLYRAFLRYSAH
jgi:hypothetical protein